jgi:hypothetical protein
MIKQQSELNGGASFFGNNMSERPLSPKSGFVSKGETPITTMLKPLRDSAFPEHLEVQKEEDADSDTNFNVYKADYFNAPNDGGSGASKAFVDRRTSQNHRKLLSTLNDIEPNTELLPHLVQHVNRRKDQVRNHVVST